jgi:hypothetical protein
MNLPNQSALGKCEFFANISQGRSWAEEPVILAVSKVASWAAICAFLAAKSMYAHFLLVELLLVSADDQALRIAAQLTTSLPVRSVKICWPNYGQSIVFSFPKAILTKEVATGITIDTFPIVLHQQLPDLRHTSDTADDKTIQGQVSPVEIPDLVGTASSKNLEPKLDSRLTKVMQQGLLNHTSSFRPSIFESFDTCSTWLTSSLSSKDAQATPSRSTDP